MNSSRSLSLMLVIASAVLFAGYAVHSLGSEKISKKLSSSPFDLQAHTLLPRLLALADRLPATPAEREYRLGVLSINLKRIQELNAAYESYAKEQGLQYDPTSPIYSATPLSLLSQSEFELSRTGLSVPESLEYSGTSAELNLEYAQIHSAAAGQGLTASRTFKPTIRDQGACGGCWAFSAVLTLEKLALDTIGTQYDFSMQYLIDCDEENNGCSGGWPTLAYKFVMDRGVPLYSYYPFKETKNACRPQEKVFRFGKKLRPLELPFSLPIVNKLTNLGIYLGLAIYGGEELQFLGASDNPWKPLSCKINNRERRVSHAVTIVESTSEYVKIQNSWTKFWADGGFKKIIPCDSKEELFGTPSRIFSPVS